MNLTLTALQATTAHATLKAEATRLRDAGITVASFAYDELAARVEPFMADGGVLAITSASYYTDITLATEGKVFQP